MKTKDGRELSNMEIAAMDAAGELERLINHALGELTMVAEQYRDAPAVEAYKNALMAVELASKSLKLQRGW